MRNLSIKIEKLRKQKLEEILEQKKNIERAAVATKKLNDLFGEPDLKIENPLPGYV